MTEVKDLLASGLAHLRAAKRVSGTSGSYRKDNPTEYAAVTAYLNGGARPNATTDMGKGLVEVEDARRQAAGSPPPPPPPPPPTGTTITAPRDLGALQVSSPAGSVFNLSGDFGDQRFTADKAVTFVGGTMRDARFDTSAGQITFSGVSARKVYIGETALAPGTNLARRTRDISLLNCDLGVFLVFAAERVTIRGCDVGPSMGMNDSNQNPYPKPMIACSNPGDNLSASPYDVLVEDCFIHDITMQSNTAEHVEGILIYAGNGITIRNVTFARIQGTADLALTLLGYSSKPSANVPDLQNVLVENCHGHPEPHVLEMDAYYNVSLGPGIRGLDKTKLYNNNVWPLGITGSNPGAPATIAAPPGWPR